MLLTALSLLRIKLQPLTLSYTVPCLALCLPDSNLYYFYTTMVFILVWKRTKYVLTSEQWFLIWGHSTTPSSYAHLTVSRSINMLCHWHVGWQLEKLLHREQLSSKKPTRSHLRNSTSRTSAKDFRCELSHAPKLPMGNNYKSYC